VELISLLVILISVVVALRKILFGRAERIEIADVELNRALLVFTDSAARIVVDRMGRKESLRASGLDYP